MIEYASKKLEVNLYNDHFQNYKQYQIPKAQLIIADIPYNIGKDAYGSNPAWYIGGNNSNGASELAGKEFFDTDKDFRISEFLHFCSKMLIKEPKEPGDVVIDPCAGSGTTLKAAAQCERRAFGFEIKKDFYKEAQLKVLPTIQKKLF